MRDEELWEKIKPFYDSGMGILRIAQTLHSSRHRVTRLLREHGIDTGQRSTFCHAQRDTLNLFDVMKEKAWSNLDVALKLGVNRRTVSQWRSTGLTLDKADELALAMGYMPQDLWDDWWEHC